MRTLVGAAEPDDPDPARGFTAVSSTVPWLPEWREPTIPLTRASIRSGHLTSIHLNSQEST